MYFSPRSRDSVTRSYTSAIIGECKETKASRKHYKLHSKRAKWKLHSKRVNLKLHSKRVCLTTVRPPLSVCFISTSPSPKWYRQRLKKTLNSSSLNYTRNEWRWKLHSKRVRWKLHSKGVKMETTLERSEDGNYTQNEWRLKLHSKRGKMETTLETSEDEK